MASQLFGPVLQMKDAHATAQYEIFPKCSEHMNGETHPNDEDDIASHTTSLLGIARWTTHRIDRQVQAHACIDTHRYTHMTTHTHARTHALPPPPPPHAHTHKPTHASTLARTHIPVHVFFNNTTLIGGRPEKTENSRIMFYT